MTDYNRFASLPRVAFCVERCGESFARPTIEAHHYLHRWPHPLSLPFAYRLTVEGVCQAEDGRPFALVVMKKPQHNRQSGLFGMEGLPTCWQVLDLARVWVHPDLQEVVWGDTDRHGEEVLRTLCIFSRMTAMVLRRVQRDWLEHHPPVYPELPYHIELVLSYCDRDHHEGTSYRASGFTLHGQTSDRTKDVYIRRLRRPSWLWDKPTARQLFFAEFFGAEMHRRNGGMK